MNNETLILISNVGLILSIIPVTIHGIEAFLPMQARWVTNWVLPFFGLMVPNRGKFLTYAEQITMLDSALETASPEKHRSASDYIFILLFEQRQGGIGFIAVAAGAVYGLTLSLADRNPIHFIYTVLAVLMLLANANHAGVPFLGHHPKTSKNGRNVGIVFTPFWAIAAVLNGLAFVNTLG
jgi:hypothetical protein